jgi:hypothetical protein
LHLHSVENKNKKKGNMSLGRKDGVIIESIYLTRILKG